MTSEEQRSPTGAELDARLEALSDSDVKMLRDEPYQADSDLMWRSAKLTVRRLAREVLALREAIRKHRDERGDDRCHLDDGELYAVLPEGDARPEREAAVTLENCAKYIACRQQGREYISPQVRIEELEAENKALREENNFLCPVGDAIGLPAWRAQLDHCREHVAELQGRIKELEALLAGPAGRGGLKPALLRARREAARMTQQVLAERLGVARSTVVNWEAGKTRPDADELARLGELLGCPAAAFFGTAEGRT